MTQREAAMRQDVYLPQQFANQWNCEAHARSTAPEIMEQLKQEGLIPAAFVAGVGTGGTVMGVSRFLKRHFSQIRICPVQPAESPTLSTGHKAGTHRIQGISDEFVPQIVNLESLDTILSVSDGDSILMAQKLANTLGLGLGISSGCNFIAAVMLQDQLPPNAPVVTVLSDDNKKYLSTDLFRYEPARETYLAPQIELLDLHVIGRLPTSKLSPRLIA